MQTTADVSVPKNFSTCLRFSCRRTMAPLLHHPHKPERLTCRYPRRLRRTSLPRPPARYEHGPIVHRVGKRELSFSYRSCDAPLASFRVGQTAPRQLPRAAGTPATHRGGGQVYCEAPSCSGALHRIARMSPSGSMSPPPKSRFADADSPIRVPSLRGGGVQMSASARLIHDGLPIEAAVAHVTVPDHVEHLPRYR